MALNVYFATLFWDFSPNGKQKTKKHYYFATKNKTIIFAAK